MVPLYSFLACVPIPLCLEFPSQGYLLWFIVKYILNDWIVWLFFEGSQVCACLSSGYPHPLLYHMDSFLLFPAYWWTCPGEPLYLSSRRGCTRAPRLFPLSNTRLNMFLKSQKLTPLYSVVISQKLNLKFLWKNKISQNSQGRFENKKQFWRSCHIKYWNKMLLLVLIDKKK